MLSFFGKLSQFDIIIIFKLPQYWSNLLDNIQEIKLQSVV